MATSPICYPGRSKWHSPSSRPHVVRTVAAAARGAASTRNITDNGAALAPLGAPPFRANKGRRRMRPVRAHEAVVIFGRVRDGPLDDAPARLSLCATSLRRIRRRRPSHRFKLLAQFGDLAFQVCDLFPGRKRHPGTPHAVLNPPAEVLARPSGACGELIEAASAFLATRPSLMQPGIGHLIGLLERPARRPEQRVETVADHLADTLGSLRLSVSRRIFPFLRRVLLCHALSLGRPMPIYEYRCADCGKRPSIFFRSLSAIEASPPCPNCGGRRLTRLISRTAQVLSEDSRLEQLSDSAGLGDDDENDPKSMARWAKRMGQKAGGDEKGDEFAP